MMNRLLGGVAVATIALTCAYQAEAQQTASILRGVIVDQTGQAIPGASVTIIDTRTNAASVARSSQDGNFAKTGLRVGGPYTVTVVAEGFEAETLNIGSLTIGSNEAIRIVLAPSGAETIVVTGQRIGSIDISNGAGTVFSAEDIDEVPVIDRDLTGILELDPLVSVTGDSGELGVISFGGIEPRLNGFVVDGALIGDKFKLEEAFYPTLRQPISIDVIEAAAATFSEYSALTTGAQGGLVNTVTKQGSNEFDGRLFYRFGNDSLIGDEPFGDSRPQSEFDETEWGFTVSGPIVEDKLFFVANYEEFEATTPVLFDFDQAELAAFETVRQAFLTATDGSGNLRYEGFDPGVKENSATDETTSERLFLKLQWLVNDFHTASAWYLKTEDLRLQNTSNLDFLFPTAYYDKTTDMDLWHGQLVSEWTNNLTTTLRAVYKEQVTGQNARGDTSATGTQFPTFVIENVPGLGDDVSAGPDPFRQANAFNDEQLQLFASADYVWNNHIFTLGGEYQDYELFNLFGQFGRGEYTFASVQDVLDGNAEVFYQNIPGNNIQDRVAEWGYQKLDLFAQDEWQVTPDLSITYGLRYERYMSDDSPIPQGNFAAEYGANRAGDLDGLDILQPRFGFDWDAPLNTRVQGGVGLFSGGDPVVWFSNAYSPLPTLAFGDVTDYSGFTSVPAALQAQVDADTGPFNYDIIDPNFNIPSLWKASIRADREFDFSQLGLGDGWLIGVQLAYSKVKDSAAFINLAQLSDEIIDPALAAQVAANTGVAPDGRPIYSNASSTGDAIMLTNTDEGESLAASIAVEKEWDFGLSMYGSYTYTDSDRLLPGSSSRHISNYRSLVTADRNSAAPAGTSVFEVEDRFVFQGKYQREFFQDLTTRFVLKGVFESGPVSNAGYALTSSNRIFGRAAGGSPFSGVDLLYVPALDASGTGFDDPIVLFEDAATEAAVFDRLDGLGLLSDAGGFVEKNGLRGAWNQRFDLGISQELPGFGFADKYVGDNNLRLTMDIFNVANLLNSEWGTQYDDPNFDSLSPVAPRLVTAATAQAFRDGTLATPLSSNFVNPNSAGAVCQTQSDCVYVYRTGFGGDKQQRDLEDSVYKIRIGIRYEF